MHFDASRSDLTGHMALNGNDSFAKIPGHHRLYYMVKPLIPRAYQIQLRRLRAGYLRRRYAHIWPIDARAAPDVDNLCTWPNGKRFALVLTHDVEGPGNDGRCRAIMKWESEHGLRSSFNLVPLRSKNTEEFRGEAKARGFEIGVHGLSHDGKLYDSEQTFRKRSQRINHYLREWGAVGFRSPAMHHNLEWLRLLDIAYDSSTFDTDPFQPQHDGVHTILPFEVHASDGRAGYVELPCTMPQDFTLFVENHETGIDIWKRKVDWIAANCGMVVLNTHPDYMSDDHRKRSINEYPATNYRAFLQYLVEKYEGQYWNALPREVAGFWRERSATRE